MACISTLFYNVLDINPCMQNAIDNDKKMKRKYYSSNGVTAIGMNNDLNN